MSLQRLENKNVCKRVRWGHFITVQKGLNKQPPQKYLSASEFNLAVGPVLFVLVSCVFDGGQSWQRGTFHLPETHRCHPPGEIGGRNPRKILSKPTKKNRSTERRGWESEVKVTLTSNMADDQWEGRSSWLGYHSRVTVGWFQSPAGQ